MPAKPFERQPESLRLDFKGMNIVRPADTMPPGKYPYALNVRAYQQGAIGPRIPQGAPETTLTGVIHSLQLLIDNSVSPGYSAWVSGSGSVLNVQATQVATGFSGNRLGMASYRPAASPQPWMYVADTNKAVKVNASNVVYNTGIAEPTGFGSTATAGDGGSHGGGPTYPVFYQYKFRSSVTGAVSNPSPPMLTGYTPPSGHVPIVGTGSSPDPQVDLCDIYRQDVGLINPTYVTTVLEGGGFIDTLTDLDLAANPLMQYDDFEPYPSIGLPQNSVVTVTGTPPGPFTATWVSGAKFDIRWLPGTLINTNGFGTFSLYMRPTSPTVLTFINNQYDVTGLVDLYIPEPILAAQRLPTLWGPTDNTGYFFSVGDPLRPGTLYFTKGNNPDSAPDTNQIEVTSPSEWLMNGAIVNGLGVVMSTERGWLIYPNFANAVATVVGVQGSPFQLYETIQGYGLYAKEGICTDGGANLFFWSKEGIRISQGGLGSQSLTDADLYNLFPHEGQPQQTYTLGATGLSIKPPDYTNPNSFALRWAEGYLYADYQDSSAGYWTLVCDLHDLKNPAWSVDQYAAPAAIHADTTGQNIGTATGCTDGGIRPLASSGVEESSNMILAMPAFDAGDIRATKCFGDIYVEASVQSLATVGVQLFSSRYATNQTGALSSNTLTSTSGVRSGVVLDLTSGVEPGIYATDAELIFTISLATFPPDSLLYAWQPTIIPQPETTGKRATDWDDGGIPGDKFVQGCLIEADTANIAKSFAIQSSDDLSLHVPLESPAAWNGQSTKTFSLATPFISHSMRIVPKDAVPWRQQGWILKYVFEPYPSAVENWQTELLSHGFEGWQHIKEINIPYLSNVPLTLTLLFDQQSYTIPALTLPSSGGVQQKLLVIIPPNKFKLVSYGLTGTSRFRLWKEDMEVKVGPWGRTDAYRIVRPFGGKSSEGAEV